jgi:mannuronan synthase
MTTVLRGRLPAVGAILHALPVIGAYIACCALVLWLLPERAWSLKGGFLLTLGLFSAWRYLWAGVFVVRSLLFERVVFPRLRQRAEQLPAGTRYPQRLFVVIATYREQQWISQRMLRSVLRAAQQVPCRTTLFVSTGSEAEDEVFRSTLAGHPCADSVELVLMRQAGKRSALAYALRAISRRVPEPDDLVVLMDGDTALAEDMFEKTLPLFRLLPKLGAVTANNHAHTDGAPWYRDWYNLRFSMRHRHMNAMSISRRVLALTGRFSVFRAGLAIGAPFIAALEDDTIDHWLYGRIRFVTGDDKSTWFVLLREGWEMLYVPDALAYCLESSGDQPFRQSFAKMTRWFGNMLRNNWRSIRLGPKSMGLFTWWSLVDQRLSIWTALVGPTTALLLGVFSSAYYVVFYLVLAVLVRCVQLLFLALEGHRVVLRDLPLLFFTQWAGSFVKIRVLANLKRQSWGARKAGGAKASEPLALRFMETFQPVAWSLVFVLFLALLLHF